MAKKKTTTKKTRSTKSTEQLRKAECVNDNETPVHFLLIKPLMQCERRCAGGLRRQPPRPPGSPRKGWGQRVA